MTWLNQVLLATDELESPKQFWWWSSLAAIAAVVKDQVFLEKFAYKLYPNIYVMLLARSGLRKGAPINLAKQLVKRVNNTRMISGRSSIQAILKKMGTAHTVPGGRIIGGSDAFIAASEFSSSLVEDKASMTILTDLYDRIYNEGEWESLLKMETFTLKDPIVTMLVGTNEPHFKDFVTEKDVHGGFIGRMFVIAESKKHKSNALIDPLEHPLDIDSFIPHLKEIAQLKGPFESLSKTDAGEFYKRWYKELDEVGNQVEDKTGTIERIGDSALKVAMLLSLSQRTDKIITLSNMQEAIIACERLVGNIRKSTITQGSKQQFADQKALIIEELLRRENHLVSREQILKKYWMHFNADQLDQIMLTFDQGGIILTESVGNKIVYRMPSEKVEEWLRHLQGK